MRFQGRCFRAHDPAWSFTPISGKGAAISGGRFNRKGEPALYLSLDIVTAVGECTQGFSHRMQPLTICEYDVDCADIADLRGDPGLGFTRADLACGWLALQLAGKVAPSQRIAAALRAEGFAGALVPSFVPGASAAHVNLVLWRWGADPPHAVRVHDPAGRLPVDQSSWPRLEP